MLRPPTVGDTLGLTVGQPVDLSALVTYYRTSPQYPQFRGLTNEQFARAYGLKSVQTTVQDLKANGWTEGKKPNEWNAPMPLCQALRSDTCPISPNYPSVQVRQQPSPPQPAPSHRTVPAPLPRPMPQARPVIRRERTWSEWFWSWFGY